MEVLIAFWSHALAAMAFASLLLWRLSASGFHAGQRLLLAAFAITGCWAWLAAIAPAAPIVDFAETARNLVWIALLYTLSADGEEPHRGVRLVYAAVAAVLGLQLVADTVAMIAPGDTLRETALLLRMTAAAGALVLVHNLYGQASPASRSNIRLAMLGLALLWGYDLNLYTISYLDEGTAVGLQGWRGAAAALTAPLFALAANSDEGWRVRLSRAATFQSLSLLAICAYFAVMTILATALRGTGWDWSSGLLVALLTVMTLAAMVLLPSSRARGWVKVKLAKHLFEHRYDYRIEWLRFTDTLGRSGGDAAPLGERVIKAFADILEATGGILLVPDDSGAMATGAMWNWPGRTPPAGDIEAARALFDDIGREGRIMELDAWRGRWGDPRDLGIRMPSWIEEESCAWAGVPLIHHERLVGLILLAAPDYRRPLDWEDFDLLRTAGRQAASSLAEAHGQEALSNARRFEEFNRRFAFIMHDIKNLVSQLSLLSRNAKRHSDNAEFRADMIATLQSSVGKMNELLARLSPQAAGRGQRAEAQPLRPILVAAIAAKRRNHDVRLTGDASQWAIADAPALEQAVGHLLQNAVEASGNGDPVAVRVEPHGEEISIAVADKGSGMDGEFVQNRLFQPFVSTKAEGFGIGAFEARSLIAAMGGRLAVDSAPGKGTTFTIFLPAAAAAAHEQRKIA
ncbi:MAG: PEP-CTERM system histidine kinase PrsK [Pseudomonadota bacterium]|nr:PEP-CTERM system histidine kinase PrsK [Pseudomonadota bacterium]